MFSRYPDSLKGTWSGWVFPAASVARVLPLLRPVGPFRYRHLAKQVFSQHEGKTILGSYVHGTRQVVSNRGCAVLVPQLRELMDVTLRSPLGES